MRAILDIIIYALDLYKLVIVAGAVLSWLIAFGVVNIRNDFVRSVWNLFLALTEPFLRPIRNFLPNTGGIDISPIILLARGDAGRADHLLLRLSVRVLRPNDRVRRQDRRGAVLRGLSPRRNDPSRDAAHADQRRRLALFGALRRALRAPKRGDFRARHRLSGKPDRRSARLPRRVRQDGAGRLAQRGRQSRLRRLPVLEAGVCRRHAVGGVGGDRAQGKLEQAERRRLCALAEASTSAARR